MSLPADDSQPREPKQVNTGGGAYYAGPLHIAGDFVAGDKIVMPAPVGVAALHQLPAPPADFTGRTAELAELRAAIQNQAVRIVGLRGLGGVGKTALAVVMANELAADYPDAQITVDLQGTTKPLTAAAALAAVVRAFEPVAKLPEDEAGLLAAYRSVLHGKRVLLLLDNAAGREQVEPLLPPPGCLLLVTSRTRFALPGLRALNLDSLPLAEAAELLLKIAPRIGAMAAALAERCGRLALALRLVGSALAEREELEPAEYAQRLSDEQGRLAELDEVAASLSLSYGLLSESLQRLWRQLGVWLGDFDELAAGAVWELEPEAAREQLGALLRYSLVAYDSAARRWRLHDLARDFARAKLEPAEAEAARGRHAADYMLALAAANEFFLQGGEDVARGLRLFDLERANIAAGWAWAAEHWEADASAARLVGLYLDAGVHVLALRLHPQERIRWLETGLAAARRAGNRAAEAQHLTNLGNAYSDLGETRAAVGYLEQALAIARAVGDRRGQANALGNLGRMLATLGQPRQAIEYHQQQLALARELGDRRAEGIGLGHLGSAYARLGETQRAIEHYEQGLAIARELGERVSEGHALGNLGNAYRRLGQPQRAVALHEQQLAIARELGDRQAEASGLGNLGIAYGDLDQPQRALECHQQAIRLARELGDRQTEAQNLGNLANAYVELGEPQRAIELYEQQLALAREIGDRRVEGHALINLGVAYDSLGETPRAIEYYEQQLAITREIGDRHGEANARWNLALALDSLGDRPAAITQAEAALALYEQVEDPHAAMVRQTLEEWKG